MTRSRVWELNDSDSKVREAAVRGIATSAPHRLHPALLLALGDPAVAVRCAAVEEIRRRNSVLAQLALEWACDDDSDSVRMRAVEGLGSFRNARARAAVVCASRDRSRFVRASAAEALGYIGGPAELPCLLQLFRDGSPLVRCWAAAALGRIRIGSQTARRMPLILREALEHERSAYVRLGIYEGLVRVGERGEIDRIVQSLRSRSALNRRVAANVLVSLAEDGLLGEATARVRGQLATALGSELDARANETLKEALERFDVVLSVAPDDEADAC